MIDISTRFQEGDLEIRSDGRTVFGIACPYDSPTTIHEWGISYTESFTRGAFDEAIASPGKVKFLSQHNRADQPLGRTLTLREDAKGLYGEFRFSNTRAANDVLELVRDGAIDGFSVGFSAISPRNSDILNGSHVVRTAVKLHEISMVTFPAYQDAQAAGVRSEEVEELMRKVEEEDLAEDIARTFANDPRTLAARMRLLGL